MAAVIGGAGTVIGRSPSRETRSREERLASVLASDAYLTAYANGIKHGNDKECRALLTELAEDGSVPVPAYISQRVETAWNKMSVLPRLRQTNFPGIAKYPFELSATGAVTHAEGTTAPAEETLSLGVVSIEPTTVKKWLSYSHEVEALTAKAYLDYIYGEIEYRVLKQAEDEAIAAILAAPATATKKAVSVGALTVTEIDFTTIFNALALLADEASRPVAIMNKQTYFNTFMALDDSSGRPIYDIVTANGAPSYYLSGVEVLFSDKLTAGNQVIVGDLDGLVVNLPKGYGVEFITDPYSLAESDMVKVVGKMHAGFGVVRDRFFAKVTVGA